MNHDEKKRSRSEAERTENENARIRLANEVRSFLQTANMAESERVHAEGLRQALEGERDKTLTRVSLDLRRLASEHDGMLEGLDEVKQHVKTSIELWRRV